MKDTQKEVRFTIALDVSTVSTGYAIHDVTGGKIIHGTIKPDKCNVGNIPACALDVSYKLHHAIPFDAFSYPVRIVVESAFAGRNMKTFGNLSMMQGALLLSLMDTADDSVEVTFVTPAQWRKVVNVGERKKLKDKKKQSIRMVKKLWNITAENNDVADALGILYYALNTGK